MAMTDMFHLPTPTETGTLHNGTAWSAFGQHSPHPPVVLLHGVGMSQEFWAPQVHGLYASHEVITYDMWGHGGTPSNPAATTLQDFTAQLLGLLDALEIAQAHVVGHSMGALVALDFAINFPDRCASAVILNAVFNRTTEQRAPVLRRAQALQTDGTMNIETTLERWFGVDLDGEPAQLSRRLLSSVNPRGYANAYMVFATADDAQAGAITDLRVPTMFATGDGDPNSTPEMSETMAQLAPSSSCTILRGHKHMMSLTDPNAVTELIEQSFSTTPASNRSRL